MKIRLLLTAFYGLIVFEIFAQTGAVTRTLSSFDQIAVSGGFDKILLKEGSTEGVSLEVSGIDADKIITEVKGSTLEIGMKKGSYSNFKATITVTYRKIKGISNSGSSDIEALSQIRGEALEINSSGSGNFTGALDVSKLDVAISGSSDMKFSGSAGRQEYAISGSGNIKAGDLKGKEAEVAISGSGDVQLHVDGPVRKAISGSGDVTNIK